jgi:uncharacterized protein YndB with AHSA1/START domain
LPHPPERVFRALTEPAELGGWFPARVEGELREGASLVFEEGGRRHEGRVVAFEPPRLVAYTFDGATLRFEVGEAAGGSVLIFTSTRLPSSDEVAPANDVAPDAPLALFGEPGARRTRSFAA